MPDTVAPPENIHAIAFAYFGVLAPSLPCLGKAAAHAVAGTSAPAAGTGDTASAAGIDRMLPLVGYTLDQHVDDVLDHECRLTPAATLVYDTMTAAAGEPPSADVIERVVQTFGEFEALPLTPEAVHVVRTLGDMGLPLGLATNCVMPGEFLRARLREEQLDMLFATVVLASEWGWCMPHPSVFRELEAGLDVAPEEILFIAGAFHTDVRGAEQAGLRTAWLRPALEERVQQVEASYVIRDLDVLLDWFGGAW